MKYDEHEENKKGRSSRKGIEFHIHNFVTDLVVVVLIVVIAVLTIKLVTVPRKDEPRTPEIYDVKHELKDIAELATQEDIYSGYIEDDKGKARKFLNTDVDIPFTKNHLGMSYYEGTVKVGYDFNEIIDNTKINQNRKAIIIQLPSEPKVLSNELNLNKIKFNEKNNIFNRLKGSDYTELEAQAKQAGLQESINDHEIYQKAESNAKQVIEKSLKSFDGYTVKFE